jgi:hypothetical protein
VRTLAASIGTTPERFSAAAKTVALPTARRPPAAWRVTPRRKRSSPSTTVPTPVVIAGPTSGAITIEPTTTAGESSRSPAVATTALRTVRPTKRFEVGCEVAGGELLAGDPVAVTLLRLVALRERLEPLGTTVSASRATVNASRSRPASRSDASTGSTAPEGSGNVAIASYCRPLVSSVNA